MAAQTLMLAAKSMGYDSNPMIGFDPEKVAEIIHLPDEHVISMMMAIGKQIKPAMPRGGQLPLSEIVFTEVGTHGVAEAAALAAAGDEAELIVAKRKSRRATCAVARATEPIDVESAGRPRGSLAVVGIGPGTADWRTPEVNAAIAGADDVVAGADYVTIYTAPENLEDVRKALEAQSIPVSSAELSLEPSNTVTLEEKTGLQTLRLIDKLEELDDVQNVYSNADIADEIVEKYHSG